jgi:hypothetical protein
MCMFGSNTTWILLLPRLWGIQQGGGVSLLRNSLISPFDQWGSPPFLTLQSPANWSHLLQLKHSTLLFRLERFVCAGCCLLDCCLCVVAYSFSSSALQCAPFYYKSNRLHVNVLKIHVLEHFFFVIFKFLVFHFLLLDAVDSLGKVNGFLHGFSQSQPLVCLPHPSAQ